MRRKWSSEWFPPKRHEAKAALLQHGTTGQINPGWEIRLAAPGFPKTFVSAPSGCLNSPGSDTLVTKYAKGLAHQAGKLRLRRPLLRQALLHLIPSAEERVAGREISFSQPPKNPKGMSVA